MLDLSSRLDKSTLKENLCADAGRGRGACVYWNTRPGLVLLDSLRRVSFEFSSIHYLEGWSFNYCYIQPVLSYKGPMLFNLSMLNKSFDRVHWVGFGHLQGERSDCLVTKEVKLTPNYPWNWVKQEPLITDSADNLRNG